MSSLLLEIDGKSAGQLPHLGGKGRGLFLLARYGFRIPRTLVVPAKVFTEAMAGLRDEIDRELDRFDLKNATEAARAAARITDLMRDLRVPDEVVADLASRLEGRWPVSVRSSALGEDAPDASFAGQFDSVLDVTGPLELDRAISRVWASTASARVLQYLAARVRGGKRVKLPTMAVLVQPMISGGVFALAATRDVTGGRTDRLLLSAARARGDAVVEGRVAPDHLRVPRSGGATEVTSGTPGGGELLPASAIERLRQQLVALEHRLGRPQEVELAFAAGDPEPWFLQTRPLTGEPAALEGAGSADPEVVLWDNSNIAESYAGPCSPFTLSFIRASYANVYRETGATLGLDPDDLRENNPLYENMLGFFGGRVFYNLQTWYRLVLQLPGGEAGARDMEGMMGVKERLPLDQARLPSSGKRLRYAFKLLALLRGQHRLASEFDHIFGEFRERYRSIDLSTRGTRELASIYRRMEADLKGRWAAPIVADIFSMTFYGALRKLAAKWLDDPGGMLANDLLTGSMVSLATQPVRELSRIAARIRQDPARAAALVAMDAGALEASLGTDPSLADLSRDLEDFSRDYGDRFVGELKLEAPSMRHDRRWILTVLQGYVRAGSLPEDGAPRTAAAEKALESLSWGRRVFFRWCLKQARHAIGYRERFRFYRSQLFGMVRDLVAEMGERLFAAGILEEPRDVFWLTVDELLGFLEGTGTVSRLGALVELRKTEREETEVTPSDRFWTLGPAWLARPWPASRPAAPAGSGAAGERLQGIACSPGILEAEAVVVRDPQDPPDLAGKILVALSNDPGWVPLYAHIAGLVLERGSALSHAANVAREMKIPAVVGVPGLLERVKSGDRLALDGARGTVTKVTKE